MPSSVPSPTSTTYNPVERGAYAVGVRTIEMTDPASGRTVPVELWYPTAEEYAGRDLEPATQDQYELLGGMMSLPQAAVRDAAPAATADLPLIVFSHGNGGHRRQSTFFCTHLASHGYLVAAPDHLGNTAIDLTMLAAQEEGALTRGAIEAKAYRVSDVRAIVNLFASLDPEIGALWDGRRVGLSGHSFGGWTTIVTTSVESPVGCAIAFAPVNHGRTALFGGAKTYEGVDLEYAERPPTLIIAGEKDSLVECRKVGWLYDAIGDAHDFLELKDAGHFHFCDRVELVHNFYKSMLDAGGRDGASDIRMRPFDELVPEAPTHAFLNGVGLAHFDAHLRDIEDARAYVANAPDVFAPHGATVVRH